MNRPAPWHERAPGRLLLGGVLPALLVLAWWLAARSGTSVVPTFGELWRVLSRPFDLPADVDTPSLAFSTAITLVRFALGFGLAVLTAVPLGILAGRSPALERLLSPAVEIARPVNPIVLLPILTVLIGLTSLASIGYGPADAWRHDLLDQVQVAVVLILWYGAFFPIYLSALHGVRSVRLAHLEQMRLLGAGRWRTVRWVILPHSLPAIAHGARVALGVTWMVTIAAELFPGTRSGLGYLLCTACKTADYEYTFAALIVIGATGLASNAALSRFERRIGHWQSRER